MDFEYVVIIEKKHNMIDEFCVIQFVIYFPFITPIAYALYPSTISKLPFIPARSHSRLL